MEQRFGVVEPNITPWRRAVCGDLTSAFDFSGRMSTAPKLPDTAAYQPRDHERHPDYRPTPPAHGAVPHQEPGTRPARPVAYDLEVEERPGTGPLTVSLRNEGRLGAHFRARIVTPPSPPRSYTVGAGDQLTFDWPTVEAYDVELHGPHGFFRRFTGDRRHDHTAVTMHERRGLVSVVVTATHPATVVLTNALTSRQPRKISLGAGGHHRFEVQTREAGG